MERRLLRKALQVAQRDALVEIHRAGGEVGPVHGALRVEPGVEERPFERP